MGTFQIGGVSIQLGGYLTADGVYRSRNNVDDIQSNYTAGIPLKINPTYHEGQTVLSSRTSRITGLVSADPDEDTKLRAYISVDFQGGAPTANYNESNSWNPRIREGWISYDRSDYGLEILAGQAWSLLTMNRVGMDPLNVNPPQTIDPNYVPGFAYARQAQFRIMKSFAGGRYRIAASVENAQTIYGGTTPVIPGSTINTVNPGTGVNATGNNFSNNFAPDLVVKTTADFNIAHLEAYGVGRVFNDRVSQLGTGQNNTVIGGGGGAAALIHVIPKLLDFQISGLTGRGISRYDPVQLPDATIGRNGHPDVLPSYEALAGLIAHPVKPLDLYAYIGTDQVSATLFLDHHQRQNRRIWLRKSAIRQYRLQHRRRTGHHLRRQYLRRGPGHCRGVVSVAAGIVRHRTSGHAVRVYAAVHFPGASGLRRRRTAISSSSAFGIFRSSKRKRFFLKKEAKTFISAVAGW